MYYFNLYKYYVLIIHIIMLYIVIVLLTILVVLLTILVVAVWILRRKIKQKELEPTHYAPYDDAHSLSGDSRYSKLCFTFQ